MNPLWVDFKRRSRFERMLIRVELLLLVLLGLLVLGSLVAYALNVEMQGKLHKLTHQALALNEKNTALEVAVYQQQSYQALTQGLKQGLNPNASSQPKTTPGKPPTPAATLANPSNYAALTLAPAQEKLLLNAPISSPAASLKQAHQQLQQKNKTTLPLLQGF